MLLEAFKRIVLISDAEGCEILFLHVRRHFLCQPVVMNVLGEIGGGCTSGNRLVTWTVGGGLEATLFPEALALVASLELVEILVDALLLVSEPLVAGLLQTLDRYEEVIRQL
jgi:hypothetical protein